MIRSSYKYIPLTKGNYALVNSEDFEYLNQFKWHTGQNRYASRNLWNKGKIKTILRHRVIMNPSINKEVDHINGNGFDNRRENLRVCTHAENGRNRKLNKNSRTGIRGVSKDNRKWLNNRYLVQIMKDNKVYYLGHYSDLSKAKKVYEKANTEHFGEFGGQIA